METAPEGEQKQQLLLVFSTNRDELVSFMLGFCYLATMRYLIPHIVRFHSRFFVTA